MLNSLGGSSTLQITIKTDGAGQSFKSTDSSQNSSTSSSYNSQQSEVAELLANVLTTLLFNSQGSGKGAQNAADPNTQLNNMLLEVLSELLGDEGLQQNGQNNLFGQNQPSSAEKSAYTKGVQDTLNALLSGGLNETASNQDTLQLGNNGLQGLNGANQFSQLGNTLGLGVGQRAGLQELSNISTHNDSPTRYFVDKEDRALAKEIGQFMDQYPEKFGKPEYQKDGWATAKQDDKSWAEALSNPDDDGMTKASMDKFLEAVGMVKSAVAGDSGNANLFERGNGGSSVGIDAALVGDRIINMGLEKLAA